MIAIVFLLLIWIWMNVSRRQKRKSFFLVKLFYSPIPKHSPLSIRQTCMKYVTTCSCGLGSSSSDICRKCFCFLVSEMAILRSCIIWHKPCNTKYTKLCSPLPSPEKKNWIYYKQDLHSLRNTALTWCHLYNLLFWMGQR